MQRKTTDCKRLLLIKTQNIPIVSNGFADRNAIQQMQAPNISCQYVYNILLFSALKFHFDSAD